MGNPLRCFRVKWENCGRQVKQVVRAYMTTMAARTFEQGGVLPGYENLAGKYVLGDSKGLAAHVDADMPAARGHASMVARQPHSGPACAQLSVRRWTIG